MKKIMIFLVLGALISITGCKKEYEIPVITTPGSTNVEVSKSVDLSFGFNAEGGYKSSSRTATG